MIHLGTDELNRQVYVSFRDLETHVYGRGVSRMGKSRLIESICSQLTKQGKSYCLIDPHGKLYREFLSWLAFINPPQPVTVLDPSHPTRVTGFNPFTTEHADPARIQTKVDRMVKATTRIWGREDAVGTPRIAKFLKCIYYALLEQRLSLNSLPLFLAYQSEEREEIIRKLRSEDIRTKFDQIYNVSERAFRSYMDSTESRLDAFTHPHLRRVMGLRDNSISVREVVEERGILLVNLQAAEDDLISEEANRIIGTLLINEIWEYFRKQQKKREFYLIIDECHLYLTHDIAEMIDQAAKYGLHLILFHQRTGQLTPGLSDALTNAHTHIIFVAKRVFTLDQQGREPITIRTPDVETVAPVLLSEYLEQITKRFLSIEEVDKRLTRKAKREARQFAYPSTQIFNEPTDEDLFE